MIARVKRGKFEQIFQKKVREGRFCDTWDWTEPAIGFITRWFRRSNKLSDTHCGILPNLLNSAQTM